MEKKIIKNILIISFVSLLLISFLLPFVLAQDVAGNVKEGVIGFKDAIAEMLAPLFGEKEALTKVFLAILLGLIVYSIVDRIFAGKKLVAYTVTIIITILSIMFLPPNFITAIRDQYGAMGAAILSVIPFMIVLVFSVRVGNQLVARVTWAFYCVYYFILYIYRIMSSGGSWWNTENLPYFGAIIVGLFIFFFIGVIRRAIFKGKIKDIQEHGQEVADRAKLLHKLQKKELEASYLTGSKETT